MSFDSFGFNQALRFAITVHERQKRGNGDPYILHCMRVATTLLQTPLPEDMLALRDKMGIAALLHDVIEDDPEKDPAKMRGTLLGAYGNFVCSLVVELSQDKNLPYEERRQKMVDECGEKSLHAQIIKLCDRLDNLSEIGNMGEDFKKRYYRETPIMLVNMKKACQTCPDLAKRIEERLFWISGGEYVSVL